MPKLTIRAKQYGRMESWINGPNQIFEISCNLRQISTNLSVFNIMSLSTSSMLYQILWSCQTVHN